MLDYCQHIIYRTGGDSRHPVNLPETKGRLVLRYIFCAHRQIHKCLLIYTLHIYLYLHSDIECTSCIHYS